MNGYVGRYQISNLGRIASLIDNKGNVRKCPKILKPRVSKKGYLLVCLHKMNKRQTMFLHRIVAIHFVDNSNHYSQVNHKDENKRNNIFTNLEWCTSAYNANYGTRNQRMKDKLINDPNRSIRIIQMTIDGKFLCEYQSMHDAARINNLNQGNISNCCSGRCKTYGGYKWAIK